MGDFSFVSCLEASVCVCRGFWTSPLIVVFLVKGKGWMTFLALVSFDQRRQFGMKRCKCVGQFYNPSPFCHLSRAHSRSQTPSAFKGCLLLRVKHFCTFTSQVTRPLSSEWRKRPGFVRGKACGIF